MKDGKQLPDISVDEISKELFILLNTRNSALNIRELAIKFHISRKEALFLLVTLESQGILTWNSDTKTYSSNPESLKLILHGQTRTTSRQHRYPAKVELVAKTA